MTLSLAFAGALGLEARNVSRCHARLTVENGTAFVEDLGSRNGTLLNGQPVRGRRKLRGGDVLQVADEFLRVEDRAAGDTGDLETAAPTPAPARPPPLPRRPGEPTTIEPRPPGRLRVALTAALRALSGKGA